MGLENPKLGLQDVQMRQLAKNHKILNFIIFLGVLDTR